MIFNCLSANESLINPCCGGLVYSSAVKIKAHETFIALVDRLAVHYLSVMDALDKAFLSAVYCATLEPSAPAFDRLKFRLPISADIYESHMTRLLDRGLLERTEGGAVRLSFLGRDAIRVVLVGGVFDVIHPGHIHTLKAAKSEGDVLVVIVARTLTAQKIKKERRIFHDEALRKELVSSLNFVDLVLVGREGTLYDSVEYVRPDIIALGYDQAHSEKDVAENCKKRNINVQVLRLSTPIPGSKSSTIKDELGESIYGI